MLDRALLVVAAAGLAVHLPLALAMLAGVRRIVALRTVEPQPSAAPPPRVSIVIAARDEAVAVGPAVASLTAQAYPDFEVVVVDDRSTDGTGEILDRLAAAEPRLAVVHNRELPAGWLGKNHALQLGASRGGGELILFADADVVLQPTTLARAVAKLERDGLDHLAVAPEIEVPGYWGRAFVAFFLIAFSLFVRPWKARDPRSGAHVGIGAFNLVRASAYRAVGGHRSIALRPDDDIKLGKVLKRAGFRQDVAFGGGLARVSWYPGIGAMVRGLEKNTFAVVDYSVAAVVLAAVAGLLLNLWPWIALLVTRGAVWYLNFGIVAATFLGWAANLRVPGVRLRYFPAHPVTATLFTYTVLRAAALTLCRGAVRWRGTEYPLAELRANRV